MTSHKRPFLPSVGGIRLLYDINNTLNLCKTKLYADDTIVYATNGNEVTCHYWLNEDLKVLMEWFSRNKLTINLDKTKLMLFATKNMQKKAKFPKIEITGIGLQYVRQFNYLGVKLDSRLNFETHASECIRLVSHKLFLVSKIRGFINKQQSLTIYRSKIMPYFDYGDIFLIGVQAKTRDMLQKMQNRALRLILNRDSRHNVWGLHHEALIPFLDDRRICHLANIVYKRKDTQDYVQVPNRHLRNYDAPIFIEYQSQNATFERSILFKGAKLWNQMSVEDRNIRNYESFKRKRKTIMLANIK